MVCTKIFLLGHFGQMGHFGPKDGAHPHKSESTLSFFLKSCRMKGSNRYMKIVSVIFQGKKSFGAI